MHPPEEPSRPATAEAPPHVGRLGGGTAIAIWNLARRLDKPPRLEAVGGDPPAPLAALRLPLAAGGTRVLWALPAPETGDLVLRAHAGEPAEGREFAVGVAAALAPIETGALLDGLTSAGRRTLLSALLGVWAGMFGLARSRSFLGVAHRIVLALSASPAVARAVAAAGHDKVLLATAIEDRLGDVTAAFLVAGGRLQRLAAGPHVGPSSPQGRRALHALCERRGLAAEPRLVVVGSTGLAVRKPLVPAALPSLGRWWKAQPAGDRRLRAHLIRTLAAAGDADRHAAVEFQARFPLAPVRLRGTGAAPEGEVNLAVTSRKGILVGGWLRDPLGLIRSVDLIGADGRARPLGERHRLRRQDGGDDTTPVDGFVAFAAARNGSDVPLVQPQVQVTLASGATHDLVPPPQPFDAVERRSAVLRALPPQRLEPAMIAATLAPMLGALQEEIRAGHPPASEEEIGTPVDSPVVSVVVPLYRVVDFLRTQVAALATDRQLSAAVEVLYVIDSPEMADEIKHLLEGLSLLYGMGFRVVTMGRNGGYAMACNAGAAAARGRLLVFLNSDVVPAGPGWLAPLAQRLASGRYAACGPKLLFEDGSIQHAGMYFARDLHGRWLNHHFHKGLPGGFAAANVERPVPAVTGACLAVDRATFEAVAGFTEDYVIGDYEDSDLCLKVRAAGHDIGYLPGSVLFHLERQSIRRHGDYMAGVAAQYNAWLHAGRWAEAMEALARSGEAGLRSAA